LEILDIIKRNIVTGAWYFTAHALKQCDKRGIDIEQLLFSLIQGEIIEDYPNDPRGHSCLILSYIDNEPVHTVCGLTGEKTVFITAYFQELPKWVSERRRRESVNNCKICQGNIEKKRVTVEREWKGKKIIIEDVPAMVCEQCGESYFDSETTMQMEKIKKASVYPLEKNVSIPASVRQFDQISNL